MKKEVISFAISKILLVIVLAIFFLPLFVLPFFNHACTDDYFCGYNLNNLGFWNYQHFVYTQCGGRFAATFAGSVFAYNNFLYNHYYLHSLLFLCFNTGSVYFLFRTVNNYFLHENYSNEIIILSAFIFTALSICVYPEFSTYNFWFSSAVTYQLPIILLQFEISFLIIILYTHNNFKRIIFSVIVPILVFIIIGFNELFIVVHLFLIVTGFYISQPKKHSALWAAIILSFVCSCLIVLLSPGSQVRAERIVPKSTGLAITSVLYHTAEVFWTIFKSPFFWMIFLCCFFYGSKKQNNTDFIAYQLAKKKWLLPLMITSFILSSVTIAVIGLKGGILPDRYLNGVTYFTLILLIIYSFILGLSVNESQTLVSIPANIKRTMLPALLIIVLLCNTQLINTYKSLISAPAYDDILKERENTLNNSALTSKIAVVENYNGSLNNYLKKHEGSTKTYLELIKQKPALIFFEEDLATPYSIDIIKKFYRLDSIIIKKN